MKTIFFIMLVFFLAGCSSTVKIFQTCDADKLGVKSHKFRGTIFKNSYPAAKLSPVYEDENEDSLTRFTPAAEDIRLAEKILAAQIQKDHSEGSATDRNLNNYFRQYAGFINEAGDKIIHINLYWEKYSLPDRLKSYDPQSSIYIPDFTIITDGGYHYWNTNVNLTTCLLERPKVNNVW